MMDDQDKQMIHQAGDDFYRSVGNVDMTDEEKEMRGDAIIDRLYMPWHNGEHYFQDKPDSIRHRVTWDLVSDMFWQGYFGAKREP